MVQRRRARPVTPPPVGQKRLEEALRGDPAEREEVDRPRRSGPRGSPEAPPYEQRLMFWFLQREEAISERTRAESAGAGVSPRTGEAEVPRPRRPSPSGDSEGSEDGSAGAL